MRAEAGAFCFHAAEDSDRLCEQIDDGTGDEDDDFRKPGQPFDVINRFIFPFCTDTLTDDGHQSDADTHGGDSV